MKVEKKKTEMPVKRKGGKPLLRSMPLQTNGGRLRKKVTEKHKLCIVWWNCISESPKAVNCFLT